MLAKKQSRQALISLLCALHKAAPDKTPEHEGIAKHDVVHTHLIACGTRAFRC